MADSGAQSGVHGDLEMLDQLMFDFNVLDGFDAPGVFASFSASANQRKVPYKESEAADDEQCCAPASIFDDVPDFTACTRQLLDSVGEGEFAPARCFHAQSQPGVRHRLTDDDGNTNHIAGPRLSDPTPVLACRFPFLTWRDDGCVDTHAELSPQRREVPVVHHGTPARGWHGPPVPPRSAEVSHSVEVSPARPRRAATEGNCRRSSWAASPTRPWPGATAPHATSPLHNMSHGSTDSGARLRVHQGGNAPPINRTSSLPDEPFGSVQPDGLWQQQELARQDHQLLQQQQQLQRLSTRRKSLGFGTGPSREPLKRLSARRGSFSGTAEQVAGLHAATGGCGSLEEFTITKRGGAARSASAQGQEDVLPQADRPPLWALAASVGGGDCYDVLQGCLDGAMTRPSSGSDDSRQRGTLLRRRSGPPAPSRHAAPASASGHVSEEDPLAYLRSMWGRYAD